MPRRIGHWLFAQPQLLLALTSLFWAGNIVLGRHVADSVPPIALAQIRWSGAAVLLLPFAWRQLRRDAAIIRAHLPILLLLSLTGVACYNALAYWALGSTEAINAVLMQSSAPLLIGLWSFILFRERPRTAQVVGIVTSLAGVVVIVSRGDPAALLGLRVNGGDLWMVAAMVVYALYSALLRLRPPIHWLSLLAVTVVMGQALLIPATAIEFANNARIELSPAVWGVLAYVAVFPSILAYLFFNRGVELIGANRAGIFFHLIAVFGSILAVLFLGERPELFHLAGFVLVLAGVVIAQR